MIPSHAAATPQNARSRVAKARRQRVLGALMHAAAAPVVVMVMHGAAQAEGLSVVPQNGTVTWRGRSPRRGGE